MRRKTSPAGVAITLLYCAGLVAVVRGTYLLLPALGWIVGGFALFGISLLLDRERQKDSRG